jgi:hypothetical protein
MRPLLFSVALLASVTACGQLDTAITLDLLNAPSSPGSVLLGIAESDIQRPTDPTAFMLSLRQATNDFSTLPNNYAIELSPGLIWGKQRSAAEIAELGAPYEISPKGSGPATFKETFVLSFAVKNITAPEETQEGEEIAVPSSPQLGVGFKFALKRGSVKESSKKALRNVYFAMTELNAIAGNAVTAFASSEPVDAFLATEFGKATILAGGGAAAPMVLSSGAPVLAELWGLHTSYNGKLAADGLFTDAELFNDPDGRTDLEARVLKWSDGSPGVTHIRKEIAVATAAGNQATVDLLNGVLDARKKWINEYWQNIAEQRAELAPRVKALGELASSYKLERVGTFWDLAGGLVLDFLDRRFDNSNVTKAGIWTTYGNEGREQVSWQVLARYLYNPENVFMNEADSLEMQNIHNLDAGGRLSFDSKNNRFSFGLEFLGRAVLNDVGLDPTWRTTANASYDLGNNRLVTFSLGKNFDGTVSKSGNLIAALNFLVGLGGKKEL